MNASLKLNCAMIIVIILFTSVFYGQDSTGTVSDIDGNVYKTVKIGKQWWMAENLKVTHYRNGDPIRCVTNDTVWNNLYYPVTGAYCAYYNTESNANIYGYLYNWYAIDDSRNIAPAGWHVPTDEEWKELEMALGMSQSEADATRHRVTNVGGKLKETGEVNWNSPNTGATNESGFSGLPGGFRKKNGRFSGFCYYAYFWSATECGIIGAWFRHLYYDYSDIWRSDIDKQYGLSVRLIRDDKSFKKSPMSINKIEPGAEGVTYSTSFGNVNIFLKNNKELHVMILVEKPESFCLKSGSQLTDFIDLKSGKRNYRYNNMNPPLVILDHLNGNKYLLSDFPEKMELTYSLNQSDKKFSCNVCGEIIDFEIK